MNESNKQIILTVINTLNNISVSGKDNLDLLLASIMALENILKEAQNEVLDGN